MADDDASVWFITGCSAGFGRESAQAVLDRDRRVAATARRPEQLDDRLAGHGERALKRRLDVTDHAEVVSSVKELPLRFLLGAPALELACGKSDELRADCDAWRDTTLGADDPEHQKAM